MSSHSSGVDHLAVGFVEDPARAGIDHGQPGDAEVATVGPPHHLATIDLAVCLLGMLAQCWPTHPTNPVQDTLLRDLLRGQIAEVLVHPVGHVRPDDPLVPPGHLPDLVPPGSGGVPVVVHVMVVEDHR